jgi:hypothetical protein
MEIWAKNTKLAYDTSRAVFVNALAPPPGGADPPAAPTAIIIARKHETRITQSDKSPYVIQYN